MDKRLNLLNSKGHLLLDIDEGVYRYMTDLTAMEDDYYDMDDWEFDYDDWRYLEEESTKVDSDTDLDVEVPEPSDYTNLGDPIDVDRAMDIYKGMI